MTFADNGFGDLVPIDAPFKYETRVYSRVDGILAIFDIGTQDEQLAIQTVSEHLGAGFPAMCVVGSAKEVA